MCTPLFYAGIALFTPTPIKGGEMIVLVKFEPDEVLKSSHEQHIKENILVSLMT